MTILLNQVVPDFNAQTTQGLIGFHHWIDQSWAILFSHPKAFTPVCTTEFMVLAKLSDQWASRNTKVIGLAVDSVELNEQWLGDIGQHTGQAIGYPIIADLDYKISMLYGMLPHVEERHALSPRVSHDYSSVRSVFIIDPNKRLRLSLSYPSEVGRDFDEILRALDALQLADSQQVETPANWRPGDRVQIP